MKAKIIFITILILFAALLACASYKPTPAPVPMKTFEAYSGEVIHGFFNIEDGSGPEGMTITVEPNVFTITSKAVTPIADFPNARRYTYYFDYTFGNTSQVVIIKSYDNRKREVINSIVFNVVEDELQVFTECGEITEPNKPVSSGLWWNNLQQVMRENTISSLKFHYNGVVAGKWGLSPKYESLEELKDLIAQYEDPNSPVMQGWLVYQSKLAKQTELKYDMLERVAKNWQQKEIAGLR